MSPIYLLYLLPLIFIAYFLKATAGFGSMIVMLAVGSLIIGPVPALLLTALLDVVGGLALLKLDSTKDTKKLWQPLSLAMLIGVVLGALLLKLIALPRLQYVLGATLFLVGIWLMFFRHRQSMSDKLQLVVDSTIETPEGANTRDDDKLKFIGHPAPASYQTKDLLACLISGTSGGLTGISAPPLLYYFGSRFGKEALRRILTRIFLVESLTRVVTYSAFGVMRMQIVLFGLALIPVMYLGLYVGNHAFFKIPERWFGRLAGLIAIASGLRLITS